jgi:hypothetical protein
MKVLLLTVAQCLSVSGLASAQCAPSEHVYIDPRLVPHKPQRTQDQVRDLLASPRLSEETKQKILSEYEAQNQPIQIPMNNGYVLISPLNPCIQQFVPLR